MPIDTTSLPISLLAPFERNSSQGGSQRATTMAEQLEAFGSLVTWHYIPPRSTPLHRKLVTALARQSNLVDYHRGAGVFCDQLAEITIASHSYMAQHLPQSGGPITRAIDFHNLEWRLLMELSKFAPRARSRYLVQQANALRRYETQAAKSADVVVAATPVEGAWLHQNVPGVTPIVVPNLLPVAAQREAAAIAAQRNTTPEAGDYSRLVYVGTLTFTPNALSLLRFLSDTWPLLLAHEPALELYIAGESSPDLKNCLNTFSGVKALGYTSDLSNLLSHARAAILPLDVAAGSSLRFLYYALASVPVVCSQTAVRGLTFSPPFVASDTESWINAIESVSSSHSQREIARLQDEVKRLHLDPRPWASLHDALLQAAKAK